MLGKVLEPRASPLPQVGVVHDIRLQELRLYTDYGRCCRPLFIVKDQQLAVKKSHIEKLQQRDVTQYGWQDLIQDGLLECAACQLPPFHAPNGSRPRTALSAAGHRRHNCAQHIDTVEC